MVWLQKSWTTALLWYLMVFCILFEAWKLQSLPIVIAWARKRHFIFFSCSVEQSMSASKWWQFSFKYISHQLSNNEALFHNSTNIKRHHMMQTCTYKRRMRACIDIMKPCHGGGRLDRKESERRERETCLG